MRDRKRLNRHNRIDEILRRMIAEYGFILYDLDGTETALMKMIRELIKETKHV